MPSGNIICFSPSQANTLIQDIQVYNWHSVPKYFFLQQPVST